jgi:predicted TIM-barrel fold metal-dependent hydrolase
MIFDTNIHITVNETWDDKIKKNKFSEIIYNYKKNKLKGFCAVGINNLGDYNHSKFISMVKKYKFIHPVAGFNLKNNIKDEFEEISKLGFRSIKIHPRANNLTLNDIDLEKIVSYSNIYKLNLLICTYFNSDLKKTYFKDPKYILAKGLKNLKTKAILMHGGCERILEFAELIRFNDNLFLDLSLTLMKYEFSSVDNDIKYLFHNFDKKIMLGSDWPEINYKKFIKRINFFSKNLKKEKKINIYYKNALSIFK